LNREDGSPLRIPDGIEPISAYRAWTFTMQGSQAKLHSLGGFGIDTESPWDGAVSGWVVASCSIADHPGGAPDELCTCGFYSVKTRPLLLLLLGVFADISDPEPESGVIFGRVELAGKVIEHDLGYRSERARIAEVIAREGDQYVYRLATLLGVPIGDPLPTGIQPPPWRPPPTTPSSPRLRVREWVQDAA
jgi:hypothetical protein